jgi:uncharacterized delta-60 repeat protein
MPTLTGKTIGQLDFLSGVTSDTLIPVELSGLTYHTDFQSFLNSDQYLNVGNSNTAITINYGLDEVQEIILNDDPNISFSNGIPGKRQTLLLKQELPGQRTITWDNNLIWSNSDEPIMQNIPYTGGGSIDYSFVIGTGFNSNIQTIQLQPDGKILVGGLFTNYSGVNGNSIVRLNTDGSIDTTFNIGNGFVDVEFGDPGTITSIQIQTDGKIIVGGYFDEYSGTSVGFGLIRLNTDGSIDNSFVIGAGFNSQVNTIEIQPDGKILVGGQFSSYSGVSRNNIIRLNADGSVDTSFVIGTGFGVGTPVTVLNMALQPDGKIIVGGIFGTYSGVTSVGIIRLNTDGSVDNSFNVGAGFNFRPYTIQLQSDGKILVGGRFTTYSGVPYNRIIRLNTDGSIDTSFVIDTGFNSQVNTIELQSNGKILVGGQFTSYSGASYNRIIRLNTDGSVDTSFVIGTGFNNIVQTIQLQPDGKILVGGFFTSYIGVTSNNIIRLDGYDSQTTYNVVNIDYNGTYYIGSF